MFDALNSFWGGAVSLAGGLIVFISLYKAIASRPRLIAYDFRSVRINPPKLPEDFEVSFKFEGNEYPTIHKTEIIIKNETTAPLTKESFISPPVIKAGPSQICVVRKVSGIDDSRGNALFTSSGEITFDDLMVPIDSSATFEIVSVSPIDQIFHCIHKDSKAVKRNYGWAPRAKLFPLGGAVLSLLPALLVMLFVTYVFGRDYVNSYATTINEGWKAIGAPEVVAPFLTFFHVSIAVFIVSLLYRWHLRATEAEQRFTELKQ